MNDCHPLDNAEKKLQYMFTQHITFNCKQITYVGRKLNLKKEHFKTTYGVY